MDRGVAVSIIVVLLLWTNRLASEDQIAQHAAREAEHELAEDELRSDLVAAKAAVRALVYLHNSDDDYGTYNDTLYVCVDTYEVTNPEYAARVMETMVRPRCRKHEVLVTFSVLYDEDGRNGSLGEPEVIPHAEGRPDILGAILQ